MRLPIAPVIYVAVLLLLALAPLAMERQRAHPAPGMEAPVMRIYERLS